MTERMLMSHEVELSPDSKLLAEKFARGVDSIKPELFQLADELICAYPDRQWDLILSEDTGARLLTRFIHQTLNLNDIKIPVYHIGASRVQRKRIPIEIYKDFIGQKAIEHQAKNALVITENIGLGLGAKFMQDVCRESFSTVDVAALVSRDGHHEGIGDAVFLGGEGHELADRVVATFEEVVTNDEGKWVNSPLTSIVPNVSTLSPHADRHGDTSHQPLANYCYRKMDSLARLHN